ncbi:Na+/H+ antiporter subunit A [Humidisolicoccus flavus]|uniref:Na+/H+ antiporter subunit A n=1 Tax=Humidisolicoccus flavus TaxID=3111414 RepID=UPI003248CCD0
MLAAVALSAVIAVLSAALSGRVGRWIFLLPAASSLIAAVWFASLGPQVWAGGVIAERIEWMPAFDIALDFRLGVAQWVLAMVVTGVGSLIFAYCSWYFTSETLAPRTVGLLTAFAGSMLGLVLSDDLVVMYVFWEATTIFSYLLVGLNHRSSANRKAAHTALIVTTLGGLSMLTGILMIGAEYGTRSLAGLVELAPQGVVAQIAIALVLVGAISKSALVPFHFWLPGAMAAPTPVSAYLHAAAMVKAGVFLVAALSPGFAELPYWRPTLLVLGLATMILGGYRAMKQLDIKLLLAHGTVSQLGLLIAVFSLGTKTAIVAGFALLVSHAVFKAALFMVVGIVDRSTGTRDLRELGGLFKELPLVGVIAIVAASAMAALPPTSTFVAKELALKAADLFRLGDASPEWLGSLAFGGIVLGSALTVAYSLRFVVGTFFGTRGQAAVKKQSPVMIVFPSILAVAVIVGGFSGSFLDTVFAPAANAQPAGEAPEHLSLWHGFTLALLGSVIAIVAGIVVFVMLGRGRRKPVEGVVSAARIFQVGLRGIDRLAVELTGRTQTGSLPLHVTAIMLTVLLLPGSALAISGAFDFDIRPYDSIGQLAVAIAICIAAIFAANSRGRLRTFMLLGVVGYGVAILFLLHGAPDLALTQVLAETVFLVLLVLVLRRLPSYFTNRPLRSTRWVRAILAAAVGIFLSLMILVAGNARTADPVGSNFENHAYDFGYGNNIVNITLVDIRAWDTMGEVSVLIVAATGVASLIFIRTRNSSPRGALDGKRGRPSPGDVRRASFLRGVTGMEDSRRAPVLEIMTRLLFPVMILVSLYLLFAGHNLPGGGFAGGLVAGIALTMRYLAGGRDELAEAAPFDAGRLLGSGVVLSAIGLIFPVFIGGRIGESYDIGFSVFGLGDMHLVTTVFFDIGVYLIVVGAMLDFVRSLGSGIDQHAKDQNAPTPHGLSDRVEPAGGRK